MRADSPKSGWASAAPNIGRGHQSRGVAPSGRHLPPLRWTCTSGGASWVSLLTVGRGEFSGVEHCLHDLRRAREAEEVALAGHVAQVEAGHRCLPSSGLVERLIKRNWFG